MSTPRDTRDLPQDAWYAVGGSEGLEPGRTRAVSLFDRDIVLWRGESGRLHAWDNRCPHRGLRLSLGAVRGDRLVCGYHGWHYGEDGQCDFVPAHPGMTPSKKACVPVYATRDDGCLLWLNVAAAPGDAPAAEGLEFCRSIALQAAAESILSRLSGLVFLPAALDDAPAVDRPWRYRVVDRTATTRRLVWSRAGADDRTVDYRVDRPRPGQVSIAAEGAGLARETRVLFLQPAGPSDCLIHVAVVRSKGDGDAASFRSAVAAWAARLRWFIERDGPTAESYTPLPSESRVA